MFLGYWIARFRGSAVAVIFATCLGWACEAVVATPWQAEDAKVAEASSTAKSIPQNREELKKQLHELKSRKSRLPLPAKESLANSGGVGNSNRSVVNNGLARRTYLPAAWFAADFGNDPAMTLTYVFKTQCFWIVSRGNNCHYCLGHQEHKLHDAGLSDKQIAWLDYDWSRLDPMLQKGVALSRTLTLTPHQVDDRLIDSLRPEFQDPQIIELVYTIAMFNSVNRWTDALGLPQDSIMREKPIDFLTPVDDEFRGKEGGLAAIDPQAADRNLATFEEVLKEMKSSEVRLARVELPSEEATRKMLGIADPQVPVAKWERALATFPEVGKRQWDALQSMKSEGHLSEKIKTLIAWTSARHNGASTASRLAYERFEKLGLTASDIERVDRKEGLDSVELLVTQFAAKLTEHPQRISDADIEQLRAEFNDQQVAEIVYLIAAANMFDRFTEALAL